MSNGAYHLRDEASPVIRFYCRECHKWAQLRTARLLERYGPDECMPSLLSKVRPCTKRITYSNQCRLAYWDCMTDHERSAALDTGGMPDAWRERLLPPWWDTIKDICEGLSGSYGPTPRVSK